MYPTLDSSKDGNENEKFHVTFALSFQKSKIRIVSKFKVGNLLTHVTEISLRMPPPVETMPVMVLHTQVAAMTVMALYMAALPVMGLLWDGSLTRIVKQIKSAN